MRHYASSEKGFVELPDEGGANWINAECPDQEELTRLTDCYHVPEQFINYVGDPDERPRVDREGDWSITILRIPTDGNELGVPFSTVPIGIITHGSLIITLCFRPNEVTDYFVDFTRKRRKSIDSLPDFELHFIYATVFWYLKDLQVINRNVASAERSVESSVKNDTLLTLMRLQKTLVYFNTSLQGMAVMLEHLGNVYSGRFDRELYDDVDIELRQAISTVAVYTDILESTMNALGSVISNNVNTIMKRMTALSIILMVPTLVASFYGMNVDTGMGAVPYAFVVIIGISALLVILAVIWLRSTRWF